MRVLKPPNLFGFLVVGVVISSEDDLVGLNRFNLSLIKDPMPLGRLGLNGGLRDVVEVISVLMLE